MATAWTHKLFVSRQTRGLATHDAAHERPPCGQLQPQTRFHVLGSKHDGERPPARGVALGQRLELFGVDDRARMARQEALDLVSHGRQSVPTDGDRKARGAGPDDRPTERPRDGGHEIRLAEVAERDGQLVAIVSGRIER